MRAWGIVVLPVSLWAGCQLKAVQLPVNTQLSVRLTSAVSSNQPAKQPVTAVVVVPVFLNGLPVLSAGTVLTGTTDDVASFKPASGDAAEQPAAVRINFAKIGAPGAPPKSVSCVVSDIDNARETVDATGLVVGIKESDTFGAQMDRGLKKLEEKYGGLAGILSSVKGSIVKPVDPAIDFKPGVDLQLKLTRPLDWNSPASSIAVGSIAPADGLAAMAVAQPFRTVAEKPPEPSDMTNLMFLGSADQVQAAFAKAGWFAAAALSQTSKMETARAIIENRGYQEAPMSILMLDGRPPDLALQKQTDTFAKRHHIRIWQRPDTFNGKSIWVAAATHDISITFSQASRSFTHGIDPNIDGERSKVVNDLLFTGMVRSIALVDRPNIPHDASNATGDKLVTDGRLAVLEF